MARRLLELFGDRSCPIGTAELTSTGAAAEAAVTTGCCCCCCSCAVHCDSTSCQIGGVTASWTGYEPPLTCGFLRPALPDKATGAAAARVGPLAFPNARLPVVGSGVDTCTSDTPSDGSPSSCRKAEGAGPAVSSRRSCDSRWAWRRAPEVAPAALRDLIRSLSCESRWRTASSPCVVE